MGRTIGHSAARTQKKTVTAMHGIRLACVRSNVVLSQIACNGPTGDGHVRWVEMCV